MTGTKALGGHSHAITSIRVLFQTQEASKCKLSAGLADICSLWEEEMRADRRGKDQSGSEGKILQKLWQSCCGKAWEFRNCNVQGTDNVTLCQHFCFTFVLLGKIC